MVYKNNFCVKFLDKLDSRSIESHPITVEHVFLIKFSSEPRAPCKKNFACDWLREIPLATPPSGLFGSFLRDWINSHRLTERLTCIGIIGCRLRTHPRPHSSIVLWCLRGFSRGPNRAPMMPRNCTPSDGCTPAGCRFSHAGFLKFRQRTFASAIIKPFANSGDEHSLKFPTKIETTPTRRISVRETGVSHHFEGRPETPWTITVLSYWGVWGGPHYAEDAICSLSDSWFVFFQSGFEQSSRLYPRKMEAFRSYFDRNINRYPRQNSSHGCVNSRGYQCLRLIWMSRFFFGRNFSLHIHHELDWKNLHRLYTRDSRLSASCRIP